MNIETKEARIGRLRAVIAQSPLRRTEEFRLKPRVKDAIHPSLIAAEEALREEAKEAYEEELFERPDLNSKRSRLRFIRETLRFSDQRLGDFLGITANQVERYDLRGRRKKEVRRFDERFNGLFVIASLLERHINKGYNSFIDRRIVLRMPNGLMSNMSVDSAISNGWINQAVHLALYSASSLEESRDYQGSN